MMTWFTPCSWSPRGGGGTTGKSWWGVVPGSPNPDQISKIHTHFRTWPNLACSRLSDSWGDSPVFSRFIFVFSLSQFSGPNYLRALNRLGLIRQKFCHHYQVRAETKKFSKCISNSHISISFLFIWNWHDKYFHSCTLPFPRKPYPISHQNGQSVFRPKRPKTPTLPLYKGVPPPILTPFMIVRDRDKV